jgi:hypothetical protein
MFRVILNTKFAISNPKRYIHKIDVNKYNIPIPDGNTISHYNNIEDCFRKYDTIHDQFKSLENDIDERIKSLENKVKLIHEECDRSKESVGNTKGLLLSTICAIAILLLFFPNRFLK